jgi:4-hydroxy-2-oxoheptanedioate aldolase
VIEILGYCGIDFAIMDCEHGSMSPAQAEEMIRAADVVGITPITRIAENIQQNILRYLDAGSLGVQMPMINTREDAELVVKSVKYWPLGKRGLAGTRAAGFGLVTPLSEYVKQSNDETLIITHVETMDAVKNLDQMLQVPEIDVIFIGPTDLSQAMGYPGKPNEPEVQAMIDRLIRQIQEAGKVVGTIVSSGDQAKKLADRGVLYLANTGVTLLATATRQYLKSARGQ